jgi:uroporphyrinogen-III synthase
MRVLVTRPAAEAEVTRDRLAALGHEVTVESLLTIIPRAGPLPPGPFDATLVTSANAVIATAAAAPPEAAALHARPLLAVGKRTAALARDRGFSHVAMTGDDVAALVAHVATLWREPARLLYLAGANRSADLAALLAPLGHKVVLAVVYEARKTRRFSERTRDALRSGGLDVALHYSVRAAETFIACCRGDIALDASDLRHLCLSGRIADVLRQAGARHVACASKPEESALFALLMA